MFSKSAKSTHAKVGQSGEVKVRPFIDEVIKVGLAGEGSSLNLASIRHSLVLLVLGSSVVLAIVVRCAKSGLNQAEKSNGLKKSFCEVN